MANTCFPLGNLEFGFGSDRGFLHDQLPIKTIGTKSLTSFPADYTSHVRSQLLAEGTEHILWDATGRGSRKCAPGFPGLHPRRLSPLLILFCILSLKLTIAIEYNYMLCPVSPPSKSSNLEGSLGDLPVHFPRSFPTKLNYEKLTITPSGNI